MQVRFRLLNQQQLMQCALPRRLAILDDQLGEDGGDVEQIVVAQAVFIQRAELRQFGG
ncbi:hypothetical protein D3C71_1417500 [compost metagenome]